MPNYRATNHRCPSIPIVVSFLRSDNGAALAEYALVLATLSALMIVALGAIAAGVGSNLSATQSGMTSWGGTQ